MNKEEFLAELANRLYGLPQADIDERVAFYREMINDRIEDGLSEEEAVEDIGSVDQIVRQIMSETPLTRLVKEKVRPRRGLRAWEIILLILGSPVWIPLSLAAVIVFLSLYVVIWAVVLCVYASDLTMAGGAVLGIRSIFLYLGLGNFAGIFFAIGMILLCAGCAIMLCFASVWITKAILKLSKRILLGIKSLFVGREA